MKIIKCKVSFLAVFIFAFFLPFHEVGASPQSVEIIVNFSNSMNEIAGNKSKIDIARELVNGVLDKISGPSDVGLSFYGHSDKNNCDDAELLVPIRGIDKQAIKQMLAQFKPMGKASADNALLKAAERLKGNNDYRNVILITDGGKTCDGDLLKTVRELKKVYDFRYVTCGPAQYSE